MDWLNRLLAVDAPPGTSLQSAQWTLRGLLPGWLMVVLVVGFAAGSVWLYLREPAQIGWRPRRLHAGLLGPVRQRLGLILLAAVPGARCLTPPEHADAGGELARTLLAHHA